MAISRPFLLALLGVVLFGATALAVQNARNASDSDATPAAVQSDAAPAPAQAPADSGPAKTLRSAFDFSQLESGRFEAQLGAGKSRGIQIAGAFVANETKGLPKLRVRISAGGVKAGFVSLGDKAYFIRGDTGWRVPAALWAPIAQNSPLAVHPSTWVRDAKSEGSETIAGVKADHVSATLDPQAVANDFAQVASQSGGKPPRALSGAFKGGEIDVWVGTDDNILRRMSANLILASGGRIELDLRLSDVNKPQQIEAPTSVRTGAPSGALGALAQTLAGNIGRTTGTDNASLKALTSPNPGKAARAVRDHKKVVILFRNARGLDDRAMAAVMRSVDQRTKAVVLTDDVAAVERYGKLVEDLGVSQTPSIVLIDRTGRARIIEGYVDSDSLTQAVADAR